MPKNPRVPVDVVADTKQFERDLSKATKFAAGAFAAFGAAAVASVAAIGVATLKLSEDLNRLQKAALQVGTSVEAFQKVAGAIELMTDGSVDAANAIQTFQRNLADAAEGSGEAQDALDKLGLSLGDLDQSDPAGSRALIADRFDTLDGAAERSQVAMDLFGRSGKALVAAFAKGGDAVREATAQIEAAGLVSQEAAEQAAGLQDKILLAEKAFLSFRTNALAPLVPVMASVVEKVGEFLGWLEDTGILHAFATSVAWIAEKVLGLTSQVDEFRRATETLARSAPLIEAYGTAFDDAAEAAEGLKTAEKWLVELNDQLAREIELKHGLGVITDKIIAQEALIRVRREATWATTDIAAQAEKMLAHEMRSTAHAARMALWAEEKLSWFRGDIDDFTTGDASTVVAEKVAEFDALLVAEDAFFSDRIGASEEYADGLASIEARMAEDTAAAEQSKRDSIAETARLRAEATQAQIDGLALVLRITADTLGAIGGFVQTVSQIAIDATEEETDARKDAMRAAWDANTAVAVATAALNIPLTISQTLAAMGATPVGVALSIAGGISAGISLAGVIAKAAAGPSFHMGGLVGSRGAAPDEVNAVLLQGERVESRREVREGGGAFFAQVSLQVGPRTFDAMTVEAIRTGQGATFDAYQRGRQPVGRHNPHRRA